MGTVIACGVHCSRGRSAMIWKVVLHCAILWFYVYFQSVQAKTTRVNMCKRNIMIRKHIHLFHNISYLDLQSHDVTCQCDLYTPPFKGCVNLKVQSIEALDQLRDCQKPRGSVFSIDNSSCVIQYRVNEAHEDCTHNVTVMMAPSKTLHEPVKDWLNITATDESGVYINCKMTGSVTTGNYPTGITQYPTTSDYVDNGQGEEYATDPADNSSLCWNCTTPSSSNVRRIKPSEIADQIDIILAVAAGFVAVFLVIAFICLCRSCRKKDVLEIFPPRPQLCNSPVKKESVEDSTICDSVFVETCSTENVFVEACSTENVFVETCQAEIKKEDGKCTASNNVDDGNSQRYVKFVRRTSDDCYDNVGFNS
ncbi:uncharacterized protein LOC124269507 [Haliotis rubra]|uniref:uncharacterized protein LOC124269507 n=1 Tax=Haliotis rubra TaxID=36100 RepID=UPI001EE5077C|nr:uncharacterized protein LOC124269507 [Haliotis rubra]XP_046560492.1 uncharacterized protein LOC124269507 [Haliotis rubra]XP_046560493.1 uncharacterized protein LOC124269507 [Haliotis rubra]XP_046560494.1 uncharacterized protein LOC124269507 [Haliotis rubra]XP_046560495.1 uncharacterized protein LOC124269507 [Haliotis rubra]